jgi:DNA-directed RNA polymerase specialized sigma24 family protein
MGLQIVRSGVLPQGFYGTLRRMAPGLDPLNTMTITELTADLLDVVAKSAAAGRAMLPAEEELLSARLGRWADDLKEKGLPATLPRPPFKLTLLRGWLQNVHDHLRWRDQMKRLWTASLVQYFEERPSPGLPAPEVLAGQTLNVLADTVWPFPSAARGHAPTAWLADTFWVKVREQAFDVWNEHLLALYYGGSEDVFTVIHHVWFPILKTYFWLAGYEDEDLAQTTLIRVANTRHRFDARYRRATGKTTFSAWMYRIAHNTKVDWLRSFGRQAIYIAKLPPNQPPSPTGIVSLTVDDGEAEIQLTPEENNPAGLKAKLDEIGRGWLETKYRRDDETLEITVFGERQFHLVACVNDHPRSLIRLDAVRGGEAELPEEAPCGMKNPTSCMPDLEKPIAEVRKALLYIPPNWNATRVAKRNQVAFLRRVYDVKVQVVGKALHIADGTVTNYEDRTVAIVKDTLRKFNREHTSVPPVVTDDDVDTALYLVALGGPIAPLPPVSLWGPRGRDLQINELSCMRGHLLAVPPGDLRNQVTVLRRLRGLSQETIAKQLRITMDDVKNYTACGVREVTNSIAQITKRRVKDVFLAEVDRALFLLSLLYQHDFPWAGYV